MKPLTILAIALLAGCQSGPDSEATGTAEKPKSVTYKDVDPNTIGEKTEKAQAYCQQYGKNAYMPGLKDGNATFYCV